MRFLNIVFMVRSKLIFKNKAQNNIMFLWLSQILALVYLKILN